MEATRTSSSLGGRSISVVRQAGRQTDKILAVYNFFKFKTSLLKHVFGLFDGTNTVWREIFEDNKFCCFHGFYCSLKPQKLFPQNLILVCNAMIV